MDIDNKEMFEKKQLLAEKLLKKNKMEEYYETCCKTCYRTERKSGL